MAYLIEEAALLGDRHTAFSDEGDQHAHGYASYFFTGRALVLLKDRNGEEGHPVAEGPSGSRDAP
jgi:hypothetical protein